ncbi:MAG: glycosyltransferase [Chloroflexota bacterium]
MAPPVRVLFTASREAGYVRNALVLRALRSQFDVQSIVSQAGTYPRRLAYVLPRTALSRFCHEVAIAGFFGQPLAVWLRLWQRQPIILDAFISAYDTLCLDRKVARPASPLGRLTFQLDRLACAAARLVVVDTQAHADYYTSTFAVTQSKTRVVYLGCDTDHFRPLATTSESGDQFQVFHYGSYLPLHGTDVIVRAASLLRSEREIVFTLVGRGMCYTATRRLAEQLQVPNVRFVDWLPYQELPVAIANADVCLGGHFGASEKARRVIAGKTYQFLSMRRATIVGDCPANRELLVPNVHALYCQQNNPQALAEAILFLKHSAERRRSLADHGSALIGERFTPERAAKQWQSIVQDALDN